MRDLLPETLQLDTFNDKWAFIAVALVQTKNLRPKGWPKAFGNDFFLIGYRIFVRYHTSAGKNLRGLFIIKSETDKRKMELFGNLFTHYKYSTTDIFNKKINDTVEISSHKSDFKFVIEATGEDTPLPPESPFSNWQEARRFAGPLPFTFTYNSTDRTMLIIEGVRSNWKPEPVRVIDHHCSFIEQLGISGVRLANAFMLSNVPYYWKKGKIDPCTNQGDHFRAY